VEHDEDLRFYENDCTLYVNDGQRRPAIGVGCVTRGLHPTAAEAIIGEEGGGGGRVGAFFAIMINMAPAVDEHGGVGGGVAQEPFGIGARVGGFERIVQQALAVGGKDEAVAVGVFVVLGIAAAETED